MTTQNTTLTTGERSDITTKPNPLRGFKFSVKTSDGIEIGGYNKVSGLSDSTDVVEYREGNDGNFNQKMAGLSKHDDVVLQRGVSKDDYMNQWREQVIDFDTGIGNSETPEGYYKDLVIELKDKHGTVIKTYKINNTFPNKYEIDDLDAKSSEVIMEKVTLTVEGKKLKQEA
jgi:phage tail-like protein